VTSSLHGVVVADALGVPVQLVRPRREALFKYEDYFAGTSRDLPPVYDDVDAALRERAPGGDPVPAPPALVAAFPHDLFDDDRDRATAGGSDGR
jgi:pyruvyltransferase